ncbi:MAG: carboxypeptidase regulatory-like domain-containing protein [Acidobacteria bacterium]|nr:carboxypeptidase regulatory-like domain-containing protein [Acidobacteriota bacterium]
MYRKQLFISLVAAAMLLLSAVSASAQLDSIRGKVVLKQADGTTVPVANAVIDIYRTDLPGKLENIKTNKRGEYSALGLSIIGKYVMAVSAPGASPKIRSNFKPGQDVSLDITLDPGDGSRYTMEQAKAFAAGADKSSPGSGTGPSAEDVAKNEELKRKNAEIIEGNKKIENINAVYNNSFKNGNAALMAANTASGAQRMDEADAKYTEAIARYDEALTADPTHPGAPALMSNKASALKARGVVRYNAAFKLEGDAKTSAIETAKKDFRDAADAATKSVQLIKAQEVPADAAEAQNFKVTKFNAIEIRADAMHLFVTKVDKSKVEEGDAAYKDYIAELTEPEKKLKAQMNEAKMYFDADAMEKAVVVYQQILVEHPDNTDAMLFSGLALFNLQDPNKFQEAANYLQKFVDGAPDTHPLKADAKAVLEALKQQNVKPQKGSGGKKRG